MRQQRPIPRAVAVRSRAFLLLSLLSGCSDRRPTTVESASSAIAFDAVIEVAKLRAGYINPVEVELHVQPYYMRRGGTRIQIGAVQIMPMQRAFSQSQRLSVLLDVTQCVRDSQRDSNAAGCPVALEIDMRMVGGGLRLDEQRLGPWEVFPADRRLLLDSVRLLEVDYRGVAPQTPVMVTGATLQMRAIFTTTRGDTVRREVTWSTANAAIARVDSAGSVTAIAPGRTSVRAGYANGQAVDGTQLTVRIP